MKRVFLNQKGQTIDRHLVTRYLPSLFTFANGLCGFVAIAITVRATSPLNSDSGGETLFAFHLASWFLFAGMIFDVLDGHVARLTSNESKLGAQLDNLCDAVTFGVAPAVLFIKLGTEWVGATRGFIFLEGAAGFYFLCALGRLARFQVDADRDSNHQIDFRGLPSPAAAGCLVTAILLAVEFLAQSEVSPVNQGGLIFHGLLPMAASVAVIVLGGLMISHFRYPRLLELAVSGKHSIKIAIGILIAGIIAVAIHDSVMFVAFWFYALIVPLLRLGGFQEVVQGDFGTRMRV